MSKPVAFSSCLGQSRQLKRQGSKSNIADVDYTQVQTLTRYPLVLCKSFLRSRSGTRPRPPLSQPQSPVNFTHYQCFSQVTAAGRLTNTQHSSQSEVLNKQLSGRV